MGHRSRPRSLPEPFQAAHRRPERRAQVGGAKGHPEVAVPEVLLDLLQGRAPHHHVAGRRVAEVVEPEALDPGPGECGVERRPDL